LFQFLRGHIRPGDIVLDIGAFLGTYAIMEARWSGETGRVLAFEPLPDSYAVFRRHLAMNGLGAPRVEAYPAAVGATPGCRRLLTFAGQPYRSMIAPSDAAASAVSVDVVTIDSVCAALGRPPDWIRMDVQGLEFDVLAGAGAVIREAGPHLRIVAEMHPEQWPDYGVDAHEAADRFAGLGLRADALEPGRPLFQQDSHVILQALRR
jgi:FkbM family methyltransferase